MLRLIALGHTNAEIAQLLHISIRTVETHRAHIYRKQAVATRAELVRYALRRGLLVAPVPRASKTPREPAATVALTVVACLRSRS